MKPSICVVMIQRNERRDAPRALASCLPFADHIVVVDTGSTDDSQAQIHNAVGMTPLTYDYYTEASEQVGKEWRIANFAKARNRAIELGEETGASHVFWIDADDIVETPLAIRRAPYLPDAVYGCHVELGGGVRQVSYRLWPAAWKIRFHGWCHEWQEIGNRPQVVLNDVRIRHDATPHDSAGEDSNARNLRILTAQFAAEPDSRTAFYLGNTHKDGGRWKEAVEWYKRRLDYGAAWRDEWLFAMLYMIRCLRNAGEIGEALEWAKRGIKEAPDWQEFRMELAFIYYGQKTYNMAIAVASEAMDKPIPRTVLWREPQMYRDQPARLISWCHEHLGNLQQAMLWGAIAARRIGAYDADWDKRQAVLEQRVLHPAEPPAIVKGLRRKIALHRPGAIGDILMTLNLIPALREANPDTDIHYYCAPEYAQPEALGAIMLQAGVDMVMEAPSLPAWRKSYDKVVDLVGYPLAEGYPDKAMGKHLLQYFSDELGLLPRTDEFGTTRAERLYDPLPALTLRRPERRFKGGYPYATLQTQAGWSKYKTWPKWTAVCQALADEIDIVALDDPIKWSLSDAVAVFANARMHIGIDSFCNHLTNYYWTDEHGGRRVPGVILWGSTQASAAGYPHNTNISLGLPCQPCFRENPAISRAPRGPCINPPRPSYDDDTPHACMDGISVDQVIEAVREMWRRTKD